MMIKTVIAVLFLAVAADAALACSCLESGPPCEAYWKTDVVFSGTVLSMSEIKKGPDSASFERLIVKLAVDNVYKGAVANTQIEVRTGLGGGDCGYHFEKDQGYLVYAWRGDNGTLSTGICSRTRPLAEATEDLAYFKNLPPEKSVASISGKVERYSLPLKDDQGPFQIAPLAGVKVTATQNGKTVTATSDAEGKYRFTGLSQGKYKVEAQLRSHLQSFTETEVEVNDRGCAEIDFREWVGASIEGRVVDANGLPMNGVKVDLLELKDANTSSPTGKWRFTNGEGKYNLPDVQPGKYILGVNLIAAQSDQCPRPRSFYIGNNSTRAGLIEIGEEDLKGIDIQVPLLGQEREITGVVLNTAGRPVSFAAVTLRNGTEPHYVIGGQRGTDQEGRFALKAIEGCTYQVMAFTYGGRVRPDSDVIEEQRHAEPVQVTVTKAPISLKLVLSEKGFMHTEDEKRPSPKP